MIHASALIILFLYIFVGLLAGRVLFFFFPKLEKLFGGEEDL